MPTAAAPFAPQNSTDVGFWGVYFLMKERFIGSAVNVPPLDGTGFAAPSDPRADLRDLEALTLASASNLRPEDGYLFLPMDFSTLLRATVRDAYLAELHRVWGLQTIKPAANIYNVPRSPSYAAIRELQSGFKANFSLINLHVEDPAFEILTLPPGAAACVTLVLSGSTEADNLAALARFAANGAAYRGGRAWQGAANVRTPRELDLCRRLKITFLSGPAVAPLTHRPAGQVIWPAQELPYHGWQEEQESLGQMGDEVAPRAAARAGGG